MKKPHPAGKPDESILECPSSPENIHRWKGQRRIENKQILHLVSRGCTNSELLAFTATAAFEGESSFEFKSIVNCYILFSISVIENINAGVDLSDESRDSPAMVEIDDIIIEHDYDGGSEMA